MHAVDDVSFDIGKGEVVGLVGETGCGKSCTALSIMRLIPEPGRIIGGEVIFNGKNLLELSEEEIRNIRGKDISMIFQNPTMSLNPLFKISDQIIETILEHKKIKKEEAFKEAVKWLESTGIPSPSSRVDNYPHEFSSGMQQRIMIAIALSCDPILLIADEPTTALDVTIQAQILDLLLNLRKEYNMSILYITHNLGVVAEICDKVAVMYAGKVFEFADVHTIFKNPLHPYTLGLMKALPKKEKGIKLEEIQGVVPALIDLPEGCRFCPRCDKAIEICEKKRPNLIEVEPGHFIACHLISKEII